MWSSGTKRSLPETDQDRRETVTTLPNRDPKNPICFARVPTVRSQLSIGFFFRGRQSTIRRPTWQIVTDRVVRNGFRNIESLCAIIRTLVRRSVFKRSRDAFSSISMVHQIAGHHFGYFKTTLTTQKLERANLPPYASGIVR